MRWSLRTAVVGMLALGCWLGMHVRGIVRQQDAVTLLHKHGVSVRYFDEHDPWPTAHGPASFDEPQGTWWTTFRRNAFHRVRTAEVRQGIALQDMPRVLTSLDDLPGLENLRLMAGELDGECLERLGRLSSLRTLYICDVQTWGHLSQLRGLSNLEELTVVVSVVPDDKLAELPKLPALRKLSLHYCYGLTERVFELTARQESLEELSLYGCTVREQGIEALAELPRLTSVNFTETHITQRGIESLQTVRPELAVEWSLGPGSEDP